MKNVIFILCVSIGAFTSHSLFASSQDSDNKHFVGIFAGVLDTDETDTVIGLEYEYKINSMWGVGALYEKASDAHHGDGLTSKIAAVYFHPMGGWRFGVGFGEETLGGDHPHTEDLTRVGVSYDFHIGNVGIAPSVNFDTVDGENAQVYGVALVWSF